MQKRKIHGRRRPFWLLIAMFLFLLGGKLLPMGKPVLLSSLQTLALASAMGTQPQHSMTILKGQILSDQDKQAEEIPIVDFFEKEKVSEEQNIQEETPVLDTSATTKPVSESTPEASQPIPEQYQGPIVEETLGGQAKTGFPSYHNILIKNSSNLSDAQVLEIVEQEHELPITSEGPQVLLYHTHATESFEPYDSDVYDTRNTWRSTDNSENMIAVGDEIAAAIEAWGIQVIHDTTQHDYPSYNGSYERSAATIESYLEKNPSICVALDIHRDAIQREETLVKPVNVVNGQKVAQLMIIAGCDDDGSLNIPTWKDNLRFAARLQSQIETMYPGLCRPLYVTYRKYNQHLTNGSLLFEVGSHGNTLEEAKACGRMAGDAIGAYLAALLTPEGEAVPPT